MGSQTRFTWSPSTAGPLPWDQVPSEAKRVLSDGALRLLAGLIEVWDRSSDILVTDDDRLAEVINRCPGTIRRHFPELEQTGWAERLPKRGARVVRMLFRLKGRADSTRPEQSAARAYPSKGARISEQSRSDKCAQARAYSPIREEKRDPEDHSPPQSPPRPEVAAATTAPAQSRSGADSLPIPIPEETPEPRTLPPVNRDARLDPGRLDAARLVNRRMMDRCGFRFVPVDGGLNVRIESLPYRSSGDFPDAPDPHLLAEAKSLKAELLAVLNDCTQAAFVPRDETFSLDAALATAPDPRRFAARLLVRWREDRPEVRTLLEDAATLLDPGRLDYLVRKADAANDPIRYFRRSASQALASVRRGAKAPAAGSPAKMTPTAGVQRSSAS